MGINRLMKNFLFLLSWQIICWGVSAYEGIKGFSPSSCNDQCESCDDDHCLSCIQGWYGMRTTEAGGRLTCNAPCPEGCLSNKCDMTTGHCISGCRFGHYGDKCQHSCSRPCFSSMFKCFRKCKDRCSFGYWSPKCECDPACLECNASGDCVRCPIGKFGPTCANYCSPDCKGGTCDVIDGSCSKWCTGNFYGPHCNVTCPETCIKAQYGPSCHNESGVCLMDCPNGFFGVRCSNACQRCVNNTCRKDDGVCVHGCIEGYHFDVDDKVCTSGYNGTMTSRSNDQALSTYTVGAILGVVAGAIVLAGCVAMAAVFYRRRNPVIASEKHTPVQLPAVSNSTYEMCEEISGKRPVSNPIFLGRNNKTSPHAEQSPRLAKSIGKPGPGVGYITPVSYIYSHTYDSIDGYEDTSLAGSGLVHSSSLPANGAQAQRSGIQRPGPIAPQTSAHSVIRNHETGGTQPDKAGSSGVGYITPISYVSHTSGGYGLPTPSTSDGYETVRYEGNI